MTRLSVSIVLFSTAILFTGCSDDKLATSPVTGVVTKGGKPVEGASVLFFPQGGSSQFQEIVPPRGVTGPDGTYTLSTYGTNDGAPVGAYKVTITWNEVPRGYRPRKTPHDFAEDDDEADQVVGVEAPDRLRGQYGDHLTTPLIATVVDGENRLVPFDLP